MLLTHLVLGAVVGLLMGVTGAGGGILAVPLLVFLLHLGLHEAAPIALLSVALAAGTGAVLGLRSGHVRYRAAGLMAATGLVGAPIGLWCSGMLPNGPLALLFAAVLLVTALRMFRRPAPGEASRAGRQPCLVDPADGRLRWTPRCGGILAGAGLAAGILSSLLGVGGGFVLVPVLLRATDLDMPNVTGTSLAVIALVATAGFALTWAAGALVLWSLAAPFCAGNLAGLLAGRRLLPLIPALRVRRAFGATALLAAILLVGRTVLSPGGA